MEQGKLATARPHVHETNVMNESATRLCSVLDHTGIILGVVWNLYALTGSGTIDIDGVEACLVRKASDKRWLGR
jgi:hypothetical protein